MTPEPHTVSAPYTPSAEVVEKIEGLRGLSEGATPGPWKLDTRVRSGLGTGVYQEGGGFHVVGDTDDGDDEAVLAFITALANTIREILTPKAEGVDHG